jgi:hypothetical protein
VFNRRAFFGVFAAVAAQADERTDVLEVIEPLAAALSESRRDEFMRLFVDEMPERRRLREHVAALIAFAEVTSSIELVRLNASRAELDWYMQIRARATGAVVERRRGIVKVLVRAKQIHEIEPVDFFRVPDLR